MKNNTIALLLLALLTWQCNSEQAQERDEITKLEEQAGPDAGQEAATALVEAYRAYREAHPKDNTYNPRYLYREAGLKYRMKEYVAAVNLLRAAIDEYYDSPISPQAALMLGELYAEEMRSPNTAHTIFQAMAQAFPDSEYSQQAQAKLPEGLPPLEARLDAEHQSIYSDSLMRLDHRAASNFVLDAELYALLLPQNDVAGERLYQAAEVARTTRSFTKALHLYECLTDKHPKHPKAAQALFMQAFTLDNDLKQFEQAGQRYQAFIDQYPDDDFAESALILIANLGKSEEDILRSLNQAAGQQNPPDLQPAAATE